MARTKRNVARKHFWVGTKDEVKKWVEETESGSLKTYFTRLYLLHGTDAKTFSPGTREYYKRAHKVRRRIEREQLKNYKIDENFDYDDSKAVAKYKSVMWEIY